MNVVTSIMYWITDKWKSFGDIPIQRLIILKHNKSYIVIQGKKKDLQNDRILLIIRHEGNAKTRQLNWGKIRNVKCFGRTCKDNNYNTSDHWNIEVYNKNMGKSFRNLDCNLNVESLHKACLIRKARILYKVVDTACRMKERMTGLFSLVTRGDLIINFLLATNIICRVETGYIDMGGQCLASLFR